MSILWNASILQVVDGGQIVEFDSPYVLLQNATGTFAQMVKQTGRDIADHLKTIAETSYLSKISGKRRKSQQQPS